MRMLSKITPLLVMVAFLFASTAYADRPDKDDKDKAKSQQAVDRSAAKFAGVGACNQGSASKDLDGNNIRARLYNNGHLFWKGSGNVYTVPIGGEANSIFASGIWIAGRDEAGAIRAALTDYGPFEFWPGPLDANGNAPADCSLFDRIFKITRSDLDRLNQGGPASGDILDWPWQLGAPVVDGDGNPNNYNLEGGDRPELIGEQTAWWVMNDVGNVKGFSQTGPIGLEVQVTAFAFRTADALNNTTFYKYTIIHKGSQALSDTYFGIWSDPDLGNAADDYVGSDTTLGLGYVYNGTDNDQGFDGYGTTPPALAYDFFQGPLIPSPGNTQIDPDGTVHEDARRIQMTQFVYYNNDSTVQGNPCRPGGCPEDPYNYLQGIWRDGTRMTFGGSGLGGTQPTNFMFPGDPVSREYWSEENTDNKGSRNTPADRRFLLSAGPFDLKPGDVQNIVYGIVWARSVNRLASVAQMRFDDILAQGAFNSNFSIPRAPDAPDVTIAELDGEVILEWANKPTSNNFLNKYDAPSAFLIDLDPPDGNTTYTFEGYRVWRFASAADQVGRVIATYDVANNVTTVVDDALDIATGAVVTRVVAQGNDGGVQNFHAVPNLTNYQDYYLGVQAYAFNPHSAPKIYASPIARVVVTPKKPDARAGGTVLTTAPNTAIASVRTAGSGDTDGVFGRVVNPLAVTGEDYTVRVYDAVDVVGQDFEIDDPDHPGQTITVRGVLIGGEIRTRLLTYDLVSSGGKTIINGGEFIRENGKNVPFGNDVLVADGISFSVGTAPPAYTSFSTVANGAGALSPPDGAAADFQGFPSLRPSDRQQVGAGHWMIGTGDNGNRGSFDAFTARTTQGNFDARIIVPFDFEIRFTAEGSYGYDPFCTGDTYQVPFELWRIGAATPDDPSDDVRMVPYLLDNDYTSLVTTTGLPGFNLNSTASIQASVDALGPDLAPCASGSADHSGSSANNDPSSDWFYWATPNDASPGDGGYRTWEDAAKTWGPGEAHYGELATDNSIRRMVVFNWNGGDVDVGHPYNQDMPEEGTVFRIVTSKPLAKGDVFSINSQSFTPVRNDVETARNNLDQIGIVPNPYKGASAYEINLAADQVRFTNLPDQASIRVFNLAGTLVRTLQLGGANNKWDLTTQDGLPIASGMYLIHVEVPGVGEKVIKFGVIKKRIQLDLF